MKIIKNIFIFAVIAFLAIFVYNFSLRYLHENAVLKQVISRLEADSRAAEVLVTGVNFDEATQKNFTTIKFLEYDTKGRPLEPKYFTFAGNIIQFQSLVIRFDDTLIRAGNRLKGKSAYIFWKIFMLDGANTKEYEINKMSEVPSGYKIEGPEDPFEETLWREFWRYAFDSREAKKAGVKNAQIEAPGTMFVPGYLYTIKIEHDGGLRIDTASLPGILRGEEIPN